MRYQNLEGFISFFTQLSKENIQKRREFDRVYCLIDNWNRSETYSYVLATRYFLCMNQYKEGITLFRWNSSLAGWNIVLAHATLTSKILLLFYFFSNSSPTLCFLFRISKKQYWRILLLCIPFCLYENNLLN